MKYVFVLGFVAVLLGVFAYTNLFSVSEYTATNEVGEGLDGERLSSDGVDVEAFAGTETIEALRLRNADLECAIQYESAEGDMIEGTVFTSEGSFRGDFLTESPDMSGQMLSSMILSDTEMLVWTDWQGEKQGMRVDLAMMPDTETETNEPISRDEEVEFDCESWSPVDRSVFEEPGDVLFYDFGALLQGGMEYGTVYEDAEMP